MIKQFEFHYRDLMAKMLFSRKGIAGLHLIHSAKERLMLSNLHKIYINTGLDLFLREVCVHYICRSISIASHLNLNWHSKVDCNKNFNSFADAISKEITGEVNRNKGYSLLVKKNLLDGVVNELIKRSSLCNLNILLPTINMVRFSNTNVPKLLYKNKKLLSYYRIQKENYVSVRRRLYSDLKTFSDRRNKIAHGSPEVGIEDRWLMNDIRFSLAVAKGVSSTLSNLLVEVEAGNVQLTSITLKEPEELKPLNYL